MELEKFIDIYYPNKLSSIQKKFIKDILKSKMDNKPRMHIVNNCKLAGKRSCFMIVDEYLNFDKK